MAPVEHFENRNVLKPVERPDESENQENNPDGTDSTKPDQNGDASKSNGDAGKSAENEKTEYAEMTNQRTSGNFSALPAPPGYPAAGGMIMTGPQANGFAAVGMPPPPPYMNGIWLIFLLASITFIAVFRLVHVYESNAKFIIILKIFQ